MSSGWVQAGIGTPPALDPQKSYELRNSNADDERDSGKVNVLAGFIKPSDLKSFS
jgi:hypothetical protein